MATGDGSLVPDAGPVGPIDPALLPDARRTTWAPGIPGGVPARTSVCTTLNAASYGDGSVDAASAIQAAIDACPGDGVVQLSAGTFKIASTLQLTKNVVLRGAGSTAGGHPQTTLQRSPVGTVVRIGQVSSTSTADAGAGINLTADAPKGATSVTVASATGIAAGDFLLIDVVDDPAVVLNSAPYDCPYFKRSADRSIGQRIEVAAVSKNTLTLSSPLHWAFTTANNAQVAKIGVPITRSAGLEGVLLKGGDNPYDGAGIDVWNAAYSWVKDVEVDTPNGMHVVLSGTYRFVVRDSYFHHSGTYGYGVGSYGIVLRFQTADALVENNISRYMNKPILFNASGGGNVVAYNYVDDSWATPGWQEVNIDCHCDFPHMELIEGNYAPHMGMSSTHGNAGYLTFFRNQSTTKFATMTGITTNISAIQLDTHATGMNVLGNVLGYPGMSGTYQVTTDANCGAPMIFELASGVGTSGCSFPADPTNDPAVATLLREGNYDYVGGMVRWSGAAQTLPASLYLSQKPDFFGVLPWPWVDAAGPTTATLPAKSRFEAMP
jgi:hypothetical protein